MSNVIKSTIDNKEPYCDAVSWADGAQKTACKSDSEARLRARLGPQMKGTLSIVGHVQDTNGKLVFCSYCNIAAG